MKAAIAAALPSYNAHVSFRYTTFGVNISSEIKLPELQPLDYLLQPLLDFAEHTWS